MIDVSCMCEFLKLLLLTPVSLYIYEARYINYIEFCRRRNIFRIGGINIPCMCEGGRRMICQL